MQTFNSLQTNGWRYADFQQPSNERLVVLPQTRSSSYNGVESSFRLDGVKLFKNIQILGWVVLPQTRPSSVHGVEKLFRLDVMQSFQSLLSWSLGRAPQHPLSRPSSFRGVKHLFFLMLCRLSTAFKRTAGRAPPNTVQLKSRCWVNSLSGLRETFRKHSTFRLGRAPPNTAQLLSRCWRTFSSESYAAISRTFKLMVGPRSPTSPVTAQLISRRRRLFSFWCYADFQQRSNERLVVLPQTRSSPIHGVESTFRRDGMKHFKNIRTFGWIMLPQTLPIFFHSVTEPFRLYVMEPFQELSSWWLGRAPQHPLSRPSSFRVVEHQYRFNVMQTFNNVQMNGWSWSPNHGPAQITLLSQLLVRMARSFLKTIKSLAGSCYPKHGPVPFTMLKDLFVCKLCSRFENIQVDGWAALPNNRCHGPVHFAALNIFSFWCCADFSTTFEWTVGRAPPNTVQLISRC